MRGRRRGCMLKYVPVLKNVIKPNAKKINFQVLQLLYELEALIVSVSY